MPEHTNIKPARLLMWLLPAAVAVLVWLTGVLPPSPRVAIQIGNEEGLNAYGQGKHLYNFFGWGNPGTEKGKQARRIDPVASLMIPWAQRHGGPLALEVAMCGCGTTEPVTVTVNETAHRVPLQDGWEWYNFPVQDEPTIYSPAVYIEWRSDAASRPLVHQVVLKAAHPDGWLWGAVAVGMMVAGVLLVSRSRPLSARLLWGGVVGTSAVAGRWLYEPQLLPWVALVVLGGAAALLLTWLCPNLRHRLVLWLLILWVLATPQVLGTWILDDAFISFRYARNLVTGGGFTFNPGGEIVEGYTNFLWTILMAGTMLAGFEPVLTAQVLCTGLSLATLLLVYRFAEAWWPGQVWCLVAPIVLAFNPSFLLYTARGSGMETALITFLAVGALWLVWRAYDMRAGLLAGLVCALVMMTRPDGVLVVAAGVGMLLLMGMLDWSYARAHPDAPLLYGRSATARFRAAAGLAVGVAVLYGPYFLWRYSYYGYLLPNTFYAKTGATVAQVLRGFDYTRTFVMSYGLRSVLALAGLSGVALVWSRLRRLAVPGPALLLWFFVLLTAAYVTLIGGDHFPLGRFFVPMIPALALLMTHGLVAGWKLRLVLEGVRVPLWLGWARWVPPALALLAVLLVLVVKTLQLPGLDSRDIRGRIWGENYVALKNREIGLWMRQHTPPDTVIATGIAGALPYYAHRTVIDALGLNDVYIAHMPVETIGQGVAGAEKTDPFYILDRQPDYIPHSSSGTFEQLERFQVEYELMIVRGPEGGEIWLYKRRDRERGDG